jgi:ArsR family transcriptional regulator, nickel/cobalt-responsive transcriptional repressor
VFFSGLLFGRKRRLDAMSRRAIKSEALSVPCADILKALGDDTRLKIVELLLTRAQNVQSLNASLRVDATLLSHHLRVLREARLVESERVGRHVIYRVSQRVRSSLRGRELDFGCCRLRFDDRRHQTWPRAST